MWEIFVGSFLLSIVHALIPNHWIPLIAISKSEKWTTRETLVATFITGTAHIFSTILIGILVGIIGHQLSSSYEIITQIIAPVILVTLGFVFIFLDLRHSHHGDHNHFKLEEEKLKSRSKWAILLTLSIAMFFSPCLELDAYYFHAGTFGWPGIVLVSITYLIVTVSVMMLLVYAGLKSIAKFRAHFLEHHHKLITGIILIILGILAYFLH
jgi:nickel/cobalt transporter (NicO) family protein